MQIQAWMRNHPLKACAFSSLFTFVACLYDDCEPSFVLTLFSTLLVLWALCFSVDSRRALSLIIAASLLWCPTLRAEPKPSPGNIAAGVTVIVVGGIAFYYLRKTCKRLFPRGGVGPTNVMEEFRVAGEEGEYGADFGYAAEVSCEMERLLPVTPTVFTMSITAGTNITTTMRADVGWEHTQTLWDFQEAMAEHGLTVSAGTSASYARNRHPADAEDVPITFNRETRIVKHGEGGVLITVERSTDLRDWETMLRTEVPPGFRFELPDVGTGATFYRVNARKP